MFPQVWERLGGQELLDRSYAEQVPDPGYYDQLDSGLPLEGADGSGLAYEDGGEHSEPQPPYGEDAVDPEWAAEGGDGYDEYAEGEQDWDEAADEWVLALPFCPGHTPSASLLVFRADVLTIALRTEPRARRRAGRGVAARPSRPPP